MLDFYYVMWYTISSYVIKGDIMRRAYKFLAKHLPFVFCASIISAIIGLAAMKLGYNETTSWLQISGVCTILFALAILSTIGYAIYVICKADDARLARTKKNVNFTRVASIVAFIMIFFMFALETIKLVKASYRGSLEEYFTVWRVLKYIFALPASIHFAIMAIPSKSKRNKRIKIPKTISYIGSLGIILWCIFGLLAAYRADIGTNNILKIWQLLIYLGFIVFFLSEAKFDLLNSGKKSTKGFLITGCISFIITISLSLTTTLSNIFGVINKNLQNSFSDTEVLTSLIIGIYIASRIYAYVRTVKVVAYNQDGSSSSNKFNSNHSHTHHSSHQAIVEENTISVNKISNNYNENE